MTAKVRLKVGPATGLSYWRNDLVFLSSLSLLPYGESETTEYKVKLEQQSFWCFREIFHMEWKPSFKGAFLTVPGSAVKRSAITSLHLSLPSCMLPEKERWSLSWHAAACRLPTEDQSPWDHLPSEAQRWLPAHQYLWVSYKNCLYASKRTLCLQWLKKPVAGFQREAASLKETRVLVAIAEPFCKKWWCGSPASRGICATGTDCCSFSSVKPQISFQ